MGRIVVPIAGHGHNQRLYRMPEGAMAAFLSDQAPVVRLEQANDFSNFQDQACGILLI
jgi:hypothetical protein